MRVRPSVCLPLTEQDLGSARGVHGCTYVCMGFSGLRCTLTRWRVQRQMHPPEVRVWAGWAGAFGAGKVRLLPSCPLSSSYVVPLADPRLLGVPSTYVGCACHALHRQERNAYSASQRGAFKLRLGAYSFADYAARNFPEDTFGPRPLVLSVCSTPRMNFISFMNCDIRVRTNTIFRFEDASPIRPWTQLAGETLDDVTATLTLAHTSTSTQVFMAGRYVLHSVSTYVACDHCPGSLCPFP